MMIVTMMSVVVQSSVILGFLLLTVTILSFARRSVMLVVSILSVAIRSAIVQSSVMLVLLMVIVTILSVT
jgi:hypothetical protein